MSDHAEGPAEREVGVRLVPDLDEGTQNHGAAFAEVDLAVSPAEKVSMRLEREREEPAAMAGVGGGEETTRGRRSLGEGDLRGQRRKE
ncbi:hypothetical protein B296_00001856 [Ensete ventricosum]|uniref:Uncharacterized protein n=1 Tax=Ensete ventricosum TaxID=4639 RepID=A0A427AZU8_ENSVE|nr:hypothetical protein B296_00001856 [Ensete ventricosum]